MKGSELHMPNKSYIEMLLKERYGDLHHVIPRLASEHGQEGAARELSTPQITVKQSWVSDWLKSNNYQLKRLYIRKEKVS